jgi:hypothetical protein
MGLRLQRRQSQLIYVPGYLFDYIFGEVQHGSVEIVKQHHQAIVPAAGATTVRLQYLCRCGRSAAIRAACMFTGITPHAWSTVRVFWGSGGDVTAPPCACM